MSKKNIRVAIIAPNLLGMKRGIKRIQPGLGMMYIGGELKRRGYSVFLRDTALEGYEREIQTDIHPDLIQVGESDENIKDYLREIKPHYIGVTVLFSNLIRHMNRIMEIAKEIDPRIVTIVGGNYITERYEHVLQNNKHIDFAMIGECDLAFSDFIDEHSQGREFRNVPGIVYREGNTIQVNNSSNRIMDLGTLPQPARDLMNLEKYWKINSFHNPYSKHPRVANVMTTRGCPEKCTFCTTPQIWGTSVRCRPIEHIKEELNELKNYGVGEIQFEDDTITANYKQLMSLCDVIEPMGFVWNTVNGIKINYHAKNKEKHQHMFNRMSEAGCYQVCLGLETGNQHILDDVINKRLDLNVVPQVVEAVMNSGISCHLFLIVGFPGETIEEMQRTVEFAKKLGPDSCSLSLFTPIPGTPLFNFSKNNGYLVDDFSEDKLLFAKSNIKVPGYSSEEFENLVASWTQELNTSLLKRDPKKYFEKYGRHLNEDKSGTEIFRKHS